MLEQARVRAAAVGRTEPRIWTPPLRDLADPDASWGHDFIEFCDLIGRPLDPWQRWLAVHLGELYPDGSPRYRKAIVLVARQNGKTVFSRLLILYWMWVERVPLVFGTHKDRGEAKKSWLEVIEMVELDAGLKADLPAPYIIRQTGEEDFFNRFGSHYMFGAPNRRAGRGKTVHRALVDELREHVSRDAWNALVPGMNAVADGLVVCITNEGDESAIVLHEEYDNAAEYIETGEGDEQVFLAAWSAPHGSDPMDLEALAYANPNLGHRVNARALLSQARGAVRAGGRTLADFRVEMMCQRVDLLDPAINPDHWQACGVPRAEALDFAEHRRRTVLCFDLSADGSHATLAAAATVEGVTHIEIVAAWDGYECRKEMRRDLPGLVKRIRPRRVVWFPGGPAAAVADEWRGKRMEGVTVQEARAEDAVRACMGLEEQAAAGQLRHTHDPLLDLHIRQTQRLPQGDGWRFARRGQAPIDASYAVAGAVHAARQVPVLGPVA